MCSEASWPSSGRNTNPGGGGINQGEQVYTLPLSDITGTISTPMEIPSTPLTSKRQSLTTACDIYRKVVMGVLGRTLLQSCQAQLHLEVPQWLTRKHSCLDHHNISDG